MVVLCFGNEGLLLSSTGICINVFDDIKAYGHWRHSYCPSSPQSFRLQLRECLIVPHKELLPIQLDVSAKRKQKDTKIIVFLCAPKGQIADPCVTT